MDLYEYLGYMALAATVAAWITRAVLLGVLWIIRGAGGE